MTFKERYATDEEFRERAKAQALAYYHANREKCQARTKAWRERNEDRVRAYGKEWREANPDKARAGWNREIRKRWADPEGKRRHNARVKLAYAVRSGTLVRPETCSECGGGGPIEAHHTDYDKPLEVIWLCRSCHHARPEDGIHLERP